MPNEDTLPSNPVQQTQTIAISHHSLWDAFEHALLFLSLYTLATSIALILHYFVDKWIPGVATDSSSSNVGLPWILGLYFGVDSSSGNLELTLLRGYLASLIVSLPTFVFLFLHIARRTLHNPDIINLKSRKVLIYVTLTITFLIMQYDLISLIYSLLSGNATWNFTLHFFVTILVSGVIFLYYLLQVKQDMTSHA